MHHKHKEHPSIIKYAPIFEIQLRTAASTPKIRRRYSSMRHKPAINQDKG